MYIEARQHDISMCRSEKKRLLTAPRKAQRALAVLAPIIIISIFFSMMFSCSSAKAIPIEELDKEAAQGIDRSDGISRTEIPAEQPEAKEDATKNSSAQTAKNQAAKKPAVKDESAAGGGKNSGFLLDEYQDPGKEKEPPGMMASFWQNLFAVIKYLFYLILVLAIGIAAIYGVKFFSARSGSLGGNSDLIHILDIKYLAPGKAICLVEIAGNVMAVGLTGNNIQFLTEFNQPQQVEYLTNAAAKKSEAMQQPFQNILDKVSKNFGAIQQKNTAKTRRPKSNRAATEADSASWQDELTSTGDSIRRLLDEIKEQDTQGKRQSVKTRDRGDN